MARYALKKFNFMLASLQNFANKIPFLDAIWKTIWSKRFYFIGIFLVYTFDLDEILCPSIDGPKFAFYLMVFEFTMASTILYARRNFYGKERRRIAELKKKLSAKTSKYKTESEMQEEILISREIRKLEKSIIRFRPPGICFFLRSVLPHFLFFRKYICSFPKNKFWSPFTLFISYPHINTSDEIKVGFSYFWTALITLDNQLISYFANDQ